MWNFDRSHFSKSNKDKTLQAFKMTVRTAEPFTRLKISTVLTKQAFTKIISKIKLANYSLFSTIFCNLLLQPS